MTSAFAIWSSSPLMREPRLLALALARRFGRTNLLIQTEPPPTLRYTLPSAWDGALRTWFADCRVLHAPPAEMVFGRLFPRHQLLSLCRGDCPRGEGLDRDIKLAWDFGRSHYAPLAAFIHGPACANEVACNVCELMALTASGPLWNSPMDVALRATNWLAADALLSGALGRAVGPAWPGILWKHFQTIWGRMEAYRVSSNHYLSNLLGLVLLGSVFPKNDLAMRALALARREWPRAILSQTYKDGGAYEGSIPYHAFVTEMALVARLLDPVPWPEQATKRLHAMVDIIRSHRTAGGELPLVGDDDSGRVLAVDHGSGTGRADALLSLAARAGYRGASESPVFFPASGWWTARRAGWFVHAEFGGVGFHGIGAHAHDDDFSLWVEHRGVPLFIDPGSYLYTPDQQARNEFRSAHRHTTVRLLNPGSAPGVLNAQGVFEWRGRIEPLPAQIKGAASCSIRDGIITRDIEVDENELIVRDQCSGGGNAWWFFHLHPSLRHHTTDEGLVMEANGMRWRLSSRPAIRMEPTAAGFAPCYGTCCPSVVYQGHCRTNGDLSVTWRLDVLC